MPGNLQDIPESVASSWPAPNYIDPVRRIWIVPYASVLQAVMTLMVGTRLWLRVTNKAGALGLDDALLVPAYLAATMFTALILLSNYKYGTDRHIWDVQITMFEDAALIAWLAEFAWLISTCCSKVSILLFYRRLTKGTFSRRWKYATIGAIIFVVFYCIAFVLVLVLNCRPTEAYWKSYSYTYTQDYTCTGTRALNPLSGALSVFSDFYSVILPMAMMRHFDAPRRQKIALNCVFSLGLLVVAAGSVRTYFLWLLGIRYDITWIGYDVFIWSDLETQLALICASAPALRVFFRTYLSDPMARMIHSAKSATSTRTTQRDSKHLESGNVTLCSHARGPSGSDHHYVKPSLDVVREREITTTSPSSDASEVYIIKTPADFEAWNLQNIERNRPPPRSTFLRPPSEYEMDDVQSTLSSPFTDWHNQSRYRS